MERRGREAVRRSDVAIAGIAVERAADMRYVGQEHAVTVELPLELFQTEDREGIKMRFDAVHATRYGYSAPGEKAEIVSLRSAITGLLRKRHSIPSRRASRRRRLMPSAALVPSISPRLAAPWTRQATIAHRCSPKIASPDPR
jgi:N-methylhydantoinase A